MAFAPLLLLSMAYLALPQVLGAVYDFLSVVAPQPKVEEREILMIRLGTHDYPLTSDERIILSQALAVGYRRLLIYYSLPDPWRDKFTDCSPLSQGETPANFFRRKLRPFGIAEDRYELLEVKEPYAADEPFRTLAPLIAGRGIKTVAFSTLPTAERRFALQAGRHFPGVRVHFFNPHPGRPDPYRLHWWQDHAGFDMVVSEYLRIFSVYVQ